MSNADDFRYILPPRVSRISDVVDKGRSRLPFGFRVPLCCREFRLPQWRFSHKLEWRSQTTYEGRVVTVGGAGWARTQVGQRPGRLFQIVGSLTERENFFDRQFFVVYNCVTFTDWQACVPPTQICTMDLVQIYQSYRPCDLGEGRTHFFQMIEPQPWPPVALRPGHLHLVQAVALPALGRRRGREPPGWTLKSGRVWFALRLVGWQVAFVHFGPFPAIFGCS